MRANLRLHLHKEPAFSRKKKLILVIRVNSPFVLRLFELGATRMQFTLHLRKLN